MYLIVGLGNPEPEYSKTRHNVGFDALNLIAKKYDIKVTKSGFDGLYGIGEIEGKKVILLKPQTYMNLSGESVILFVNYFKVLNTFALSFKLVLTLLLFVFISSNTSLTISSTEAFLFAFILSSIIL